MIEAISEQREVLFKLVTNATEASRNICRIGIDHDEDPTDEVCDQLLLSAGFVAEAVIALSNALSCLSDLEFDLSHVEAS